MHLPYLHPFIGMALLIAVLVLWLVWGDGSKQLRRIMTNEQLVEWKKRQEQARSLLPRLQSGDELHREAASEILRLRQQYREDMREAERDSRDALRADNGRLREAVLENWQQDSGGHPPIDSWCAFCMEFRTDFRDFPHTPDCIVIRLKESASHT
jgi:biopolymer transport protein ExbB/TolQ